MLLAASCLFYMYFIPIFILILVAVILVDYSAALLMEKHPGSKKQFLIASLIANLGILFFFKYYNFFIGNINAIARMADWNYSLSALQIILPLGLSFHTFQAMSYTIEVYHGRQKAERHLGLYALYVLYYPQLVAGPIERPQNLLPQLHGKHDFNFERFLSGLRLMLWGFFKKLVIADRIAYLIKPVFDAPHHYEGMSILISASLFSIQIYCDFSGYTDIARGASRIMGIELMKNFNAPYLSKSMSEFWRRWHISLSTWFKEYLYFPLGGNRKGTGKTIRNIMIVFLLSGLWHGADWSFVGWGFFHGLLLVAGILMAILWKKKQSSQNAVTGFLNAFFIFMLVTFLWIFFRAADFNTALFMIAESIKAIPLYITGIIQGSTSGAAPVMIGENIKQSVFDFFIIAISVSVLFAVDYIFTHPLKKQKFETLGLYVKSGIYGALFLFLIFTGVFYERHKFIYFQF